MPCYRTPSILQGQKSRSQKLILVADFVTTLQILNPTQRVRCQVLFPTQANVDEHKRTANNEAGQYSTSCSRQQTHTKWQQIAIGQIEQASLCVCVCVFSLCVCVILLLVLASGLKKMILHWGTGFHVKQQRMPPEMRVGVDQFIYVGRDRVQIRIIAPS